MGSLEKEVKNKIRISRVQKIILKTVYSVGFLGVALLAPNALQMFKKLGIEPKGKMFSENSLYNSRKNLIKKGLVKYSKDGFLSLTSLGEETMKIIDIADYKLEKPKRWDKKWRILIFDVREDKRWLRDKVREILNKIGFVKLQNSVWVYPYDCEDLINMVKTNFKIGREVLYIIADKVENDRILREHFKLDLE